MSLRISASTLRAVILIMQNIILRDRVAKHVQGHVQVGSLGRYMIRTWENWTQWNPFAPSCSAFLMNVTWGFTNFLGRGNYFHDCWHRLKLHWLLMVTWALSTIIKRQSYPKPLLLVVSTSLHKQPLNTFAGLFLLNQEQHAGY